MTIAFVAVATAITLGTMLCAALTRADRNYWPMLRVIWIALGFAFAGSGASAVVEGGQSWGTRLLFSGAILGAVIYAAAFMRRRNRVARYLPLTLAGQVEFVAEEDLRQCSEQVTSVVWHGAAPESWVLGLEEACAEWRRKRRWRDEELPRQVAARRATRGEAGS